MENERVLAEYVDWARVSADGNLSLKFIKKYRFKLDFEQILYLQRFDENFLRKYMPRIDLLTIFETQKVSEDFIIEFMSQFGDGYDNENKVKEIIWKEISQRQKLSIAFIKKYRNKLDSKRLINNITLDDETIEYVRKLVAFI